MNAVITQLKILIKRVHKPNSYGYYVISDIDAFPSGNHSYVGEDAAEELTRHRLKLGNDVAEYVDQTHEPMIMTPEDKINYKNATRCHMCEEPLKK